MKNLYNLCIVMLCLVFTSACDDELVKKVTVDPDSIVGGEIQQVTSDVVLLYENANETIAPIQWEATDYGFPTSVTYTLQIAPDASFTQSEILATTSALTATVNVQTLNNMLVNKFGLTPEVPANLKLRVVSSISGEFGDVISATEDITITPYDPNIPPIYLIGDGQGWDFASAKPLASIAPQRYLGFIDFEQDQIFRFVEVNEEVDPGMEWGFAFFTSVPAEFTDNGDGDFVFTSDVAGTYEVIVDLKTKTIEIEKQLFPSTLYIVGDDQGWTLEQANGMLHRGGGVFVTYETLNQNSFWRFFETPSWGATQWNYKTFESGSIDELLTGTTEGDANFQFTGATGIYKITVSTLDLTIEIEPATAPTMYLVGGDNGWTFGESMTWIRGYKFSTTMTLTAGNEWRFFPESGNWGNTLDYRSFSSVNNALWSGPNGGDANFLNLVSGTYTITMDAGGIGTVNGVQ
ncbi:MAG TPA: SusE domain-containing protein [Ohtaekwangia sp.]|nr:SusE domain-containing protein [Ohtaekwangia sp.]